MGNLVSFVTYLPREILEDNQERYEMKIPVLIFCVALAVVLFACARPGLPPRYPPDYEKRGGGMRNFRDGWISLNDKKRLKINLGNSREV